MLLLSASTVKPVGSIKITQAVSEHVPPPSSTVTHHVPAGRLTVAVVSPVGHVKLYEPEPPVAEAVTEAESPGHAIVELIAMAGTMAGRIFTLIVSG